MNKVATPQNDVPLSLALLALVGFGFIYLYLTYFRFHPEVLNFILRQIELNSNLFMLSLSCIIVNVATLSIFIKRSIGLEKQGSKLALLNGKNKKWTFSKLDILLLGTMFGVYLIISNHVVSVISPIFTNILSEKSLIRLSYVMSLNIAVAMSVLLYLVLKIVTQIKFSINGVHKLEIPTVDRGELILGTTPGELTHSNIQNPKETEEWVKIPSRGINGGIVISGSVGSGKTQGSVLPLMKQLVNTEGGCPAILAIDPKRTFLIDAERIIKEAGFGDRIVKISLDGNISFNPVYVENPLRNSKFTELAEMVRAAAVNFMGKASDSPFWDISSSNLIKNAIVYCATVHGYFTLLDLYRAIIRASQNNLADDLKLKLKANQFTQEEVFNIERAIEYFETEYSQLEDRVRSGIVATSTAFINQFQEFAANRVLCPKKENLTIVSMEDLIREGKIILKERNIILG